MPNPGHVTSRNEAPPRPQGALCHPDSAQCQLARACAQGLVTGLHTHILRPQGNGQWAALDAPQGWVVGGERVLNPGHPSLSNEPTAPPAPLCRPHSAQSQLTRPCAVGFMTGPHARTTRAHRKRAAGPGPLSQTWGRGVPNPGHPSQRHEAPPKPVPTVSNARSQERALRGS